MKYLLFSSFILIYLNGVLDASMTEKQLKAAGKLVRNVCQPKTKATDEDLEKMRTGDWNIDRTAMCYLNCVFLNQKLMTKDNTVDYELTEVLVKKNLPEARKEPALDSLYKCKDAIKTPDDKCMSAYELGKCFYDTHPENYFFS